MSRKKFACKIVLLGEGGVGKTSLRKSYLGEGFTQNYQMTIGADFAAKRAYIDNTEITANIWDLAGQQRFKTMRESYYRGVSGALIVFDISRRETFDNINIWIEELKANNLGQLVPFVLIGNKCDLRDQEGDKTEFVTEEECRQFAEQFYKHSTVDIQYIETSAKTGNCVENAFEALIEQIYDSFLANP